MKKAIIDQIMLGFFLFVALIVFGATINDEFEARNKVDDLRTLTKNTTRALSKHYMYNQSISDAQDIANDLLNNTKLGKEVLTKQLITYTWRDLDGNNSPDVVTTSISGYIQNNFWYKFLDKDTFSLPEVNWTEYVTKEQSDIISFTLKYGGSNAGYYNIIGTYELDNNNCITNAKLLLVNKNAHQIGDVLGSYTNANTRFFIIPDGYNKYGNKTATLESYISITGCKTKIPTVSINGKTNATVTYFQDTYFNTDNGYDHMREIGKTYFDDYKSFISKDINYCSKYKSNGSCSKWSTKPATWEDWVSYSNSKNINFENDPNDEYIITMEDLPDGGDKDFNDINIDTTKVRIPKSVNTNEIEYGTIVE
jgi:hypothetical protein